MSELRFYTFVNCYLSSIQQGIQSFHVLGEMVNKYETQNDFGDFKIAKDKAKLTDWLKNHKTLIVLNGGADQDIFEKHLLLTQLAGALDFPMPFANFREDQKSLSGIMTACGCVLPEEIYNAVDYRKIPEPHYVEDLEGWKNSFFYVKDNEVTQYRPGYPEHELITMLKSCSLAR